MTVNFFDRTALRIRPGGPFGLMRPETKTFVSMTALMFAGTPDVLEGFCDVAVDVFGIDLRR